MAFIAGYVADRREPTEAIRERVRDFSILPGESRASYVQTVVDMRFGHVIVKHRMNYPVKPQTASDAEGNVLVILGFVLCGDAGTLLPLALSTGARSIEECEGEFVAVLVEAATGTLHVVNDRFSSRPAYILRRDEGIYFSSNVAFLLSLASQPYRPDAIGWLEVCTAGHTLGVRTTADNIQRLWPATHLTITPGRVTERQYWRLEHRPDSGLELDRHSAEVFQAFCASAERRARIVGKGIVGLSGGLDSRFVAGALRGNTEFSAFTLIDVPGADSTPETRAAAEVCSALGLRHHIEALAARCTSAADVIALTGGMRPYQHMAMVMPLIRYARSQGHSFLLGGGPGDSLAGAFIPSRAYLDPRRTAECIRDAQHRRLAVSRHWPLVFRADLIADSGRAVHEALSDSFAAVPGPTAAHRVTAWAMVVRQPAFTFTSVLHTHPDVTEAFCHLGYRYTDLMLQLPASWLYQKAFYAYMMYAALPELRQIPYSNTGRLLSGNPPAHQLPNDTLIHRTVAVARSFGKRVARRLSPGPASLASFIFNDTRLLDDLQDCVHSIAALRDILDVNRCDEFLARTRAGACPSEDVLGTLTSLCMSASTLRFSAIGFTGRPH